MSSDCKGLARREFLKFSGAAAGGALVGGVATGLVAYFRQSPAKVTILKAASYQSDLFDVVWRGLQDYPSILRRARGGRVVLKPNLVEHDRTHPINTHPSIVAAAIEVFRRAGAREVIVAEGPGHQRDTELLLAESGLEQVLTELSTPFVDLNLDSIHPVTLLSNRSELGRLFFPATVLRADLVVSMPKLKTHHWAGVTLSLKNMFGIVPGVKYGWPKNLLHWRGIHNSIVDVNVTVPAHFAIVDGIEGMQGDGPIYGEPVSSHVVIMGDNLTAVDSTGVRVMGLYPEHIPYLRMMLRHGGTVSEGRISHLGETVAGVKRDFTLLEDFSLLRTPPSIIDRIRGV